MHAENIKQLIEAGLKDARVIVAGEDGRHFTATVVSAAFAEKSRIQKQQLVYATLGNHIQDGTIHAISIKTFTPSEWEQFQKEEH